MSFPRSAVPWPVFHTKSWVQMPLCLCVCHVKWTARRVLISVIGYDVGSCAWGKDTGDISATNIFTMFIKSATFTHMNKIHWTQWGWIYKTGLLHVTRLIEPDSVCVRIYAKKRYCFFGKKLQEEKFREELISLGFVHKLVPRCFYRTSETSVGCK